MNAAAGHDLDAVIVSAVRTPVGSFGGRLSTLPATQPGARADGEGLRG